LDNEGVGTKHISYSDKYHTGYSTVLIAPTGERTFLTYRGASTHYDIKNFNLKKHRPIGYMSVAWQVIWRRLDRDIFSQAKELGKKVCYNPGKDELKKISQLRSCLEDVDVLLVNKEEAQMIVPGETLEELVRKL
jgi:sugar/nucleoside kinase (ribokinase family)